MSTNLTLPRRDAALSILSCFGISAIPILAYVAVWEWATPGLYLFLILGTYLLLGGFAVHQVIRAIRTDDRMRKLGAVGVVVGFAATIFLGLRPRTGCLDAGPCPSGLALQPFRFALGMTIASISLFLDVRNRANPLGNG